MFALSACGSTEERVNKMLAAQQGGKLVVDVDFGSIDVVADGDDKVRISVWRKVSRLTSSAEKAFLKDRPIQITESGGIITVRSKAVRNRPRSWTGSSEARYTIRVPAEFNAQLDTAGGGIKVRDLSGELKARTSGGGLTFVNIDGPIEGKTSGGGIRVQDCRGNIQISTSGGGLDVAGSSGVLDGQTSGGTVTVRQFGGPARVKTSGGGLILEDVEGSIDGSTSGGAINATLASLPKGDLKLTTSAGGITLRLPARAAFDLDASTSAGDVRCELPISLIGKAENGRMKGAVNGGGKPVYLRTSAGGISIQKRS